MRCLQAWPGVLHQPPRYCRAIEAGEGLELPARFRLRSLSASRTVCDGRGALLAIVEGRACAEDVATIGIAAERDALAGAACSVILEVAEAIRRLQ